MTAKDPRFVSEDDAARLWQRAAELQAEAAAKAEARSEQPPEPDPDPSEVDSGYAVDHVRAAALEAGIEAEFVDAALLELKSRQVLPAAPSSSTDSLARWFVDDDRDFIEVTRVVNASFSEIIAAMEKVFPVEPFNLTLKDRHGDLGEGGVLVFKIEGASFVASGGWVGECSWADMREIYVSIRRLAGEADSCQVTLRSPMAWARGLNLMMGGFFTGIGGLAGLGLGTAAANGLGALSGLLSAGVLGALLTTLVVVLGVISGGGLTVHGYRFLFDHSMRKGEGALVTLMSALALEAQGGWGVPGLGSFATDRVALPSKETPA